MHRDCKVEMRNNASTFLANGRQLHAKNAAEPSPTAQRVFPRSINVLSTAAPVFELDSVLCQWDLTLRRPDSIVGSFVPVLVSHPWELDQGHC